MNFEPGDEVGWSRASKRGRVISLCFGYGAILSVDGDTALVKRKYSNGKVKKKLDDLVLRKKKEVDNGQ